MDGQALQRLGIAAKQLFISKGHIPSCSIKIRLQEDRTNNIFRRAVTPTQEEFSKKIAESKVDLQLPDISDALEKYSKSSQDIPVDPSKTNLSSPWSQPKESTDIPGIKNLGNTCFIGAVLQAWFVNQETPLVDSMTFQSRNDALALTVQAKQWIYDYHFGKGTRTPAFFLELIQKDKPQWYSCFGSLQQQDASEFMDYLRDKFLFKAPMPAFEENVELQGGHPFIPASEIHPEVFNGSIRLSHPSKKETLNLQESILTYFEPLLFGGKENVFAYVSDGENLFEKEVPVASRVKTLDYAPFELSIVIPRTTGSAENKFHGKIEGVEEFLTLPSKYFKTGENPKYRLRSVILHEGGSSQCGHYLAMTRRINSQGEEVFIYANDSFVKEITLDQMLDAARSSQSSVFIYDKMSTYNQDMDL